MTFRLYEPERDYDAACRVWLETGWITKEQVDKGLLKHFLVGSRAWVADVDNQAECLVIATPGQMRYLDDDLDFCCISGVTTSRIARKAGFATRLTAQAVADGAASGAMVAGLGMFEEGFYSRLGFGTGGYEIWMTFDPAQLVVPAGPRPPKRIGPDDWPAVHASLLARHRGHGGCNLTPEGVTRADLLWAETGFGLGFFDGPAGELTHHVWFSTKDVGQGPYHVGWLTWQSGEQLREVLGVLRALCDQVHSVAMREPAGIQLQDFILQPFKQRSMTKKSQHEAKASAWAGWQMRICDLPACMARTHLPIAQPVRFNLTLADPIGDFLPADAPWRGCGGRYVVTLGPDSAAEEGHDASLPAMEASVGAFTRMWLGVRPSSGLAVSDEITAPAELLHALDRALRLPNPRPDWDF